MAHELDGLKGQRNYKGVTVFRIIGGFQVLGQNVSTAIEVDELLEKAAKIVEGSIRVVNNGNMACQNDLSGGFLEDNGKVDTMYPSEGI